MRDIDSFNPTIIEHIITVLFSARSSKLNKQLLWEQVKKQRDISSRDFYVNTYRMKNRGLIDINNEIVLLTEKGKTVFVNSTRLINTKPPKGKKVIVIFDIPETKRRLRDWLRFQLKWWGFEMIQKSVWVGPGPLPKEFKERLKFLDIEKCVKIFLVHNKNSEIS